MVEKWKATQPGVSVIEGGVTGREDTREVHKQGAMREIENLHSDILVQIFSYLHETELFELMLVSKHWEKAVMDGNLLWKKGRSVPSPST